MTYELEIKDEARKEIIEAYLYYEKEQQELGERFLKHLDNSFQRIIKNPSQFPQRRPPYREAFVQIFPFLIIFEIDGSDIIVYSVFHTRQDPKKKP